MLVISMLGAGAIALAPLAGLAQPAGAPSEIVFTDSQAAVLKTGFTGGAAGVITAGSKLMQPFGIALSPVGSLYVSDTGCLGLLEIDRTTGQQRVIAARGTLGYPLGIAVERSGAILVANAQALLRVDAQSGASVVLSSGGLFRAPIGVTVADNGDIFVLDALGSVIRVEPTSGAQTLVTTGGNLHQPQGLAVRANNIYVTDVATADGNFGIGQIVQVNRQTGEQMVLARGQNLVSPVGIAVEASGNLIVGDPYTINPNSADLFDGGIIRIDKNSGAQTLIARGGGNYVNPRGVVIVDTTNGTNN